MTAVRLHDTRTRSLVDLHAGRTVRMYVCGITPYDATHLGHAFTYAAFDVLARYLEHHGHRVQMVRNITDVDDDMLRKARELGVDYLELARREIARFDRDMAALAVRRPAAEPRATETIPAMVTAVAGLAAAGFAYALDDGRVYFDTRRSGRLGRFSGLDREEMMRQFAAKGGDPEAPGKRDPLDFLLWQPSAPDEPTWDSPWGRGRPGWHIECSVMAMEHLGSVIDIHGGGEDLIYPHHEAETLQSEHLTGQAPFARVWMHTGMVGLDGAKMSKSLGNLVFVSDLLERYEGTAVRRALLTHHYRESWSHDHDELDAASAALKQWREVAPYSGRRPDLEAQFHAALRTNLDTPAAIAAVDEAAAAGAGATVTELSGLLGFALD